MYVLIKEYYGMYVLIKEYFFTCSFFFSLKCDSSWQQWIVKQISIFFIHYKKIMAEREVQWKAKMAAATAGNRMREETENHVQYGAVGWYPSGHFLI
jgi:hypothetical protein